ncbi:unnamed protein product [Larinioides sclopetarius]|uniref:Poly(A) RNA polymerase mitochondrial-like central palm domain-containing protein n=1 Tax=Larinioides sclopetarius TaxID=280406 RepID=A0AAV2AEB3_9ARAC
MILLRCLKCSSHWAPRQCSKRFFLLYFANSSVVVNKQMWKNICYRFPCTLQHKSCFSTSPLLLKKKKPIGWKTTIENSEIPLQKEFACEGGKDAVPHSVLVSKLQNCSSVSKQIETFSSVLSLTDEDKEKRTAFCKWLEDVFKLYISDHKLYQFGSSVTGMGFKGCDLDVCLLTNFIEEEHVTLDNVPTPEDVESGRVSRETIARLSPYYMTKFLKGVLDNNPDITDVVRVNGRCPILKFYNSKLDIFCDLSFKNQFSLQNTALIIFLGKLDERFRVLAQIVRYWAKYCGLVDGLDKFSSYSLSLIIIHFFQTRDPPILPPVNEIASKSEYVQHGSIEDTHLLFEDLKKFGPSNNSKSVEELLQEFFFYYMNFDFKQVITPATGCSVPLSSFMDQKGFDRTFEFNTVSVQDPFRPNANITVATQFSVCRKFLFCLQLTCEALQSEAFKTESFSNPESEKLGLNSIFLKPWFISKRLTELHENTLHTIEVPSIPNAASKVKKILEYGLLFHCISFNTNSNNSADSNILLKLRCRTYNHTWHGRDLVSDKIRVQDNLSPLEKEHLISKEIAAKSVGKKKELFCEFDCECKEYIKDNETKMTVHLNFKKPSSLSVFLKEYIPCTLRML